MKIDSRFTSTDYFKASLLRNQDLRNLMLNTNQSIIFSLYCAGVAVECMLRAYILKITTEFNSKHDLELLYLDSKIATLLSLEEKKDLTTSIKKLNKIWRNDLRYTSKDRMIRLILSELNCSNKKHTQLQNSINQHRNADDKFNMLFYDHFKQTFEAANLIVEIGKRKWT
ncbi:MAG: hypothetical protein Q9M50_09005 [Methylococcales bacterium]|nr:hypothetical protein [Methylococcales bacterium]